MKKKIISIICIASFLCAFTFIVIASKRNTNVVQVNSNTALNNQKIEWGIKRGENHDQPDLGSKNKSVLEKYNGIAMGNSEKPYVYLTFDEGYEAGYTEKILAILKENEVKATFFITAHYLNTEPDLVKQMIDEGHIVGNQF